MLFMASSNTQAISNPNEFPDALDQRGVNLVLWRRQVSQPLSSYVQEFCVATDYRHTQVISRGTAAEDIIFPGLPEFAGKEEFTEDIAQILRIALSIPNWTEGKVKLETVKGDMCRRFHVDRVRFRLLCTYNGPGTQWLPNNFVDRTKLGPGSAGMADEVSGLIRSGGEIQQMEPFEVGLMRGEPNGENRACGLVHRSPPAENSTARRLFFRIDLQ